MPDTPEKFTPKESGPHHSEALSREVLVDAERRMHQGSFQTGDANSGAASPLENAYMSYMKTHTDGWKAVDDLIRNGSPEDMLKFIAKNDEQIKLVRDSITNATIKIAGVTENVDLSNKGYLNDMTITDTHQS